MLDTLLKTLSRGGTHSISDLASELAVGEGLVHQMIEVLVSLGYLSRLATSCERACEQCPMSGVCSASSDRGQAWQLTEKGRRAALGEDHGA
ncbi:MAG TPA: hypothetical protein ENO24_00040 [Chloroflexi bacterium]|nr:hypothetical protein [Chloroflexota bacterium]